MGEKSVSKWLDMEDLQKHINPADEIVVDMAEEGTDRVQGLDHREEGKYDL